MRKVLFPINNGTYEVTPGLRKLSDNEKIFLVNENYKTQIKERKKFNIGLNVADCIEMNCEILCEAEKIFREEYPEIESPDNLSLIAQEDIAIIREKGDVNQVTYLNVLFPNGWDPADKIGLDFAELHKPVAHFEKMAKMQNKIVKAMIDNGPFERFAWGLHTTDKLNRLSTPDDWESFEEIYFRVERQTTLGFPQHRAALFTINTNIYSCKELSNEQRKDIVSALKSMSNEARKYKGINENAIQNIENYFKQMDQ